MRAVLQSTWARTGAHRRALASGILCCALTACVGTPPPPGDPVLLERQAEAAVTEGRTSEAAELYGRLAASAAPPRRGDLLLQSAALFATARNYAQARFALSQAEAGATPAQLQRSLVLLAEIELGLDEPGRALETLARLTQPAEPDVLRDSGLVRARAQFALRRFAPAVQTLSERELWLDSAAEILANQEAIWQGLTTYRGEPLAATGEPTVDGWLALATVAAAQTGDAAAFKQALLEWRTAYQSHPAARTLLASLLSEYRTSQDFPTRIALLLPLSSVQRTAALALQDGFMAALLADTRHMTSQLRVYDTATLGAATAYLSAQLDGADFIVGPLLRPEVEEVAAQLGFVPTLALNFLPELPGAAATGFFQFALAPEDEAREIARRAIREGAATALALIPEDDLGLRLLDSFRSEFEQLGGQVLRIASYPPAARDFSAPITGLLNLTESTQRYRRLAANLGRALEFAPRRRGDVDMLFVAANAATGQQLAPQLRFHYAGDIPTYTTSAVYEPGRNASDADLNGLYFTDMPWVLQPDEATADLQRTLRAYWPQRFVGQGIRFYAMGFDAYSLISRLYGNLADSASMVGMSGELVMDENGQIHRRLPVAQFRSGRPVVVDLPANRPAELVRLDP